jgi:hypothetical protein
MRHNSGHYCWWHRWKHTPPQAPPTHGVAASIQQGHVEIGGSLLDPVLSHKLRHRRQGNGQQNGKYRHHHHHLDQGEATQAARPVHVALRIFTHLSATNHKINKEFSDKRLVFSDAITEHKTAGGQKALRVLSRRSWNAKAQLD